MTQATKQQPWTLPQQQPKDLEDYQSARARAEGLRHKLTDPVESVGEKEWGGNYGRATTRRPEGATT